MSFKGAHFPQEIMLTGVRWYVASPLSTRHVEELMLERGVHVYHSTINRWVITYSPQLEEAFHRRKQPVWRSWRMDKTYICVKGEWRYFYHQPVVHGQQRWLRHFQLIHADAITRHRGVRATPHFAFRRPSPYS